MANSFENIVNHVKTKSGKQTSAPSFSVSTIDFFKTRKYPIYVKKNETKPTVKNIVLPAKEEDVYLNASGYKLDKSYVNMNAFGYYTSQIDKNLNDKRNKKTVESYINNLNSSSYDDEIVIEM